MRAIVESIEHNGLALRYISSGSGSHLVLAFHGFARSPEEFIDAIGDTGILLLSFYLPGHDGAHDITSKSIDLKLWCQLLESLIDRYKPQAITVIGYSLGGRIAIATCLNWRIKSYRLLLLAPDGIQMNFLQRFALKRKLGFWIFHALMKSPNSFIFLTVALGRLGIIPRQTCYFLLRQLRDESKRRIIMEVFPLFREFISREKTVVKFLESLSTRALIVLGKQDPIISAQDLLKLPNKIVKSSILIIEDASHDLLSFRHVNRWKGFLLEGGKSTSM